MEENIIIKELKNIWPRIYRFINIIFFSILSLIKKTVYMAIQQIKEV